MNKGNFEQVDTPRNLYAKPGTPFVARFVGENNRWSARVEGLDHTIASIVTPEGNRFKTVFHDRPNPNDEVDLFLRPESILLEPDPAIATLNRFNIIVKSILFDGANSRILAMLPESHQEIQISLPQNRQFDHIQPGNRIEAGWSMESGIMFPRKKAVP
jgi:spermidine/putrescine transport system ATP-binding protein